MDSRTGTQVEWDRILAQCSPLPSAISARIVAISNQLMGAPYLADPLVGSAHESEFLVTRTDAFDCVTFVETVLALARGRHSDAVTDELVRIRYKASAISWNARNHYMSGWIQENAQQGIVELLSRPDLALPLERTLSCLSEYPEQRVEIPFIPASHFDALHRSLQDGDILFFGTTRSDLDVSHLGFYIQMEVPTLRHASKSLGNVSDEPLAKFLERFGETPGLLVVRPKEVH